MLQSSTRAIFISIATGIGLFIKPSFTLRIRSIAMSAKKPVDSLAEVTIKGEFIRSPSQFKNIISADHPVFQPEYDRYHLYVSYACPWANRCLAVRELKGLKDCIGLSVVHPTWQRTRPEDPADTHTGWVFVPANTPLVSTSGYGSFPLPENTVDTINDAKSIRDLYEMSGDTHRKYSVPVLWDKKTKQIVNNESSDIIRMFNHAFDAWTSGPFATYSFYPEELRKEIDEVNEWVYDGINNGVYKCGFAKSQEAYDAAVKTLETALDRVEEILSKHRYLVGNTLTEADIRLFMTLVRYDEVYVVYFKCNSRIIANYPNILNYCRDLYQLRGMANVINMQHIKTHYFT